MNVELTSFTSPFSFYIKVKHCDSDSIPEKIKDQTDKIFTKKLFSDINHGQYVAVWHSGKWCRGIISMESQVLIWLVDVGHYLRPSDGTIFVDLPAEFKKLPTKVFEASIHGVVPIDKELSEECEIKDVVSTTWNHGAVEKGQNTIQSSRSVYFVPLALMCTKGNDVVLGDLYLDIPGQGIVNFIDIMELWPVFLQRNQKGYVESNQWPGRKKILHRSLVPYLIPVTYTEQANDSTYMPYLSTFYSSRRKHHACSLKPEIANILPQMSTSTSLPQYEAIVSNAPKLELEESSSDDCSTIVIKRNKDTHLTAEEIEEYSQMYILIDGVQHNVLNIIINKCRDLSLCEKYKNKKSVGRATTRRSIYNDNDNKQLSTWSYTEDF